MQDRPGRRFCCVLLAGSRKEEKSIGRAELALSLPLCFDMSMMELWKLAERFEGY
jgi:hypothetical protein